jgi:hypothetical protein
LFATRLESQIALAAFRYGIESARFFPMVRYSRSKQNKQANSRDSPDEFQIGANIRAFPAFLQDTVCGAVGRHRAGNLPAT